MMRITAKEDEINDDDSQKTDSSSSAVMPVYVIGTVFFYSGQTQVHDNCNEVFCGTWSIKDGDKSPSDVLQDIIDEKQLEFGKKVTLTCLNII